jgi:hypothetical protein
MKTQAKSALVVCEYCNKQVRSRGLVSHIRLQHQIQIPKVTTASTSNPDYGKALKELDKIDRKIKKLRKQFVLFQKRETPVQNITISAETPAIKKNVELDIPNKKTEIPEILVKVPENKVKVLKISADVPIKETDALKEHSYTTEDVQILMGKIFVEQKRFAYLTTKDPFLEKELEGRLKVIIDDFEDRFHCKYKDLQKEFPDFQPTKNPKKWKNRYIQLSWFSKDNYSK